MAFHLQISRAIFKVYVPVEQKLECFPLQTVVNPFISLSLRIPQKEHTAGGDY